MGRTERHIIRVSRECSVSSGWLGRIEGIGEQKLMPKYATVPAALCLLVSLMTPAAPQAPFKLRIASVNSPPSMHTLYMRVAHEEGIYKRNGLDVDDIISLPQGPRMTK